MPPACIAAVSAYDLPRRRRLSSTWPTQNRPFAWILKVRLIERKLPLHLSMTGAYYRSLLIQDQKRQAVTHFQERTRYSVVAYVRAQHGTLSQRECPTCFPLAFPFTANSGMAWHGMAWQGIACSILHLHLHFLAEKKLCVGMAFFLSARCYGMNSI
jgi:hypothetical protein